MVARYQVPRPPLEDLPTDASVRLYSTGLYQHAVSRRVICDFLPPPPLPRCLCHSRPRLPTTLLTTFKPARGNDNARSPCSPTLLLPNAPPQRTPLKILRRISTIDLRVLPLSPQNPPLFSRTPSWPMARYHPRTSRCHFRPFSPSIHPPSILSSPAPSKSEKRGTSCTKGG